MGRKCNYSIIDLHLINYQINSYRTINFLTEQRWATIGSCAAARANIDRKRSIKLFAFSKACLSLVVGLLPGHCAIGIHNVRWIYLMVSVHLKWSNGHNFIVIFKNIIYLLLSSPKIILTFDIKYYYFNIL